MRRALYLPLLVSLHIIICGAVHSQTIDATVLKRANSGDSNAEYQIGRAYQSGTGVEKNDKEAALWYRRSADRGNASAQYELGIMLLYGWGEPQNIREGVAYLTKAAQNGNATAPMMLGELYEDGGLGKYISENKSEFLDMVPKNDSLAAK